MAIPMKGRTPVENAPKVSGVTNKRSVQDRIKNIEKRWGKEFTEVLADMHDHIFGNEEATDETEEDTGGAAIAQGQGVTGAGG